MYKVYLSDSLSPYFNLAYELYLVQNANKEDQLLFLWQNEHTVVIGRNQNPWKECRTDKLKEDKGILVRRLSGGGAVYHDRGNLNFSFISSDGQDAIQKNIELIIESLKMNGINAYFGGKNDLLVNGNKISGNAYFTENKILCHHGTLLIDSNKNQLAAYLKVSDQKLTSKGIDSIQSRVINIKELNHEITVDMMKNSIVEVFLSNIKGKGSIESVDNSTKENEILHLITKFESWEWNYGSSPQFNYQLSERFDWGEVQLVFEIEDGIIQYVKVFTDAIDLSLPVQVENVMHQLRFKRADMRTAIESMQHPYRNDLLSMIKQIDVD